MSFKLPTDYIDVAARIAEFRSKYPDGSLQQVSLSFEDFAGSSWVVYTAAAYRTPDDMRPGQGTAWEPVPGKTPYTKDSEVQNAETAAWGRAIVAVLAADTRKGIASAEEVRNRQDTRAEEPPQPPTVESALARLAEAETAAQVDAFLARGEALHKSGSWDEGQWESFCRGIDSARIRLDA